VSKADARGFCYDARCELHNNGSMLLDPRVQGWLDVPHAERPERVRLIRQVLERSGVLDRLAPVPAREATREELELVHTAAHVDAIHAASARGGVEWIGPEARVGGADSWTAALVAVGGLLECVDRVVAGELRSAFACLRPPGHHASAGRAMGFCLFNAVAVAARYLQRRHGFERVAILDWDVHHGNGTQEIFYDDPSVLFVSLHQDDLYPKGSGTVRERGVGTTVNVPLPAGTGDDGYRLAFDEVVRPALERFEPEFLVVSAGQDAAASDTHGRMSVTTEGFRSLAERTKTLFDGRLVAFLEGGYSLDHLPLCTLAVVEALAGLPPSWETDPLELDVPSGLSPEVLRAVERATPR
jgi:acetoin utilization deacetylase AcuC-like enzyme